MNVQEIDISSVIKEMLESNEKYWKISNEINGFTEFKDSFASNEKEIYDCYDYIIKTVKMIKVKNLVSSITEEMLEDSNNTEGIDKKKIEVKVMNGFKDIIPNKNDNRNNNICFQIVASISFSSLSRLISSMLTAAVFCMCFID